MIPKDRQLQLARQIKKTVPISRGTWQAQTTDLKTKELNAVTLKFEVPNHQDTWAKACEPDLPWAEDHFKERVAGEPVNPAPSYRHWPWHSAAHADDHTDGKRFDHTYPERYWPKYAGYQQIPARRGIWFKYGDLNDVVAQLRKDPFTRQAYLPIFFPEDTGAVSGQRVPCSLGYHFLRVGSQLNVNYFLRSCDITRHFLNDMYMTGRLLQWMCEKLRPHDSTELGLPFPGSLFVYISNLHMFEADEWRFK